MKEEDDPLALAQANLFMGSAYGYAQALGTGKKYLKRSVEIIRRHKLRFVTISTGDRATQRVDILSSQEVMDEVHERAAFLAQTLFIETLAYIMGQTSSNRTGIIFDHTDKSEPLVSFSTLFRRNLVFFYTYREQKLYQNVYFHEEKIAETSLDLESQFRYELPVRSSFISLTIKFVQYRVGCLPCVI